MLKVNYEKIGIRSRFWGGKTSICLVNAGRRCVIVGHQNVIWPAAVFAVLWRPGTSTYRGHRSGCIFNLFISSFLTFPLLPLCPIRLRASDAERRVDSSLFQCQCSLRYIEQRLVVFSIMEATDQTRNTSQWRAKYILTVCEYSSFHNMRKVSMRLSFFSRFFPPTQLKASDDEGKNRRLFSFFPFNFLD